MSKISFNANALGVAVYGQEADVGHAFLLGTPKSIVSVRPGIEAIEEGLRLSHVEGFEAAEGKKPAGNVDP